MQSLGIPKPKPPRRRSWRDNLELAIPKQMRIRDESVLGWARNRGQCEVCLRVRKTEPLHIKTRGSGGDDTMENVVAGCRECHIRTENAGQAGKDELLAVVKRRV